MPKQDALDFMADMDTGWSTVDMQRTVGKMMKAGENIVSAIIAESENVIECNAKRIRELAAAMKGIAESMERYTGIYAWCTQQGQTGAHTTALEDVLPLLDTEETLMLHDWMQRLEAFNAKGAL